jgi:hypothetical protein
VGVNRLKKDRQVERELLKLVEPETAGDPQSERKWLRCSLSKLADQLKPTGHGASAPTIACLLRKHDYSPRVNAKEKEPGAQHPDRNLSICRCMPPPGI